MSGMNLIMCLFLCMLSVYCYANSHRSILRDVSDNDRSGIGRDYTVELNATSFDVVLKDTYALLLTIFEGD